MWLKYYLSDGGSAGACEWRYIGNTKEDDPFFDEILIQIRYENPWFDGYRSIDYSIEEFAPVEIIKEKYLEALENLTHAQKRFDTMNGELTEALKTQEKLYQLQRELDNET